MFSVICFYFISGIFVHFAFHSEYFEKLAQKHQPRSRGNRCLNEAFDMLHATSKSTAGRKTRSKTPVVRRRRSKTPTKHRQTRSRTRSVTPKKRQMRSSKMSRGNARTSRSNSARLSTSRRSKSRSVSRTRWTTPVADQFSLDELGRRANLTPHEKECINDYCYTTGGQGGNECLNEVCSRLDESRIAAVQPNQSENNRSVVYRQTPDLSTVKPMTKPIENAGFRPLQRALSLESVDLSDENLGVRSLEVGEMFLKNMKSMALMHLRGVIRKRE